MKNIFSVNPQICMTEIILEIPDEIEKLHIESSNGDINLKKIKCENITLKTVNG